MIGTDIRHHLHHSRETASDIRDDRKQAAGPTGHLGDLATSSQSFRVASRRKLARGSSPDRDRRCRRETVGGSQQVANTLKHSRVSARTEIWPAPFQDRQPERVPDQSLSARARLKSERLQSLQAGRTGNLAMTTRKRPIRPSHAQESPRSRIIKHSPANRLGGRLRCS
jgi:hypothetical protein